MDRDLEAICQKCLQQAPGRRYGSAEGVAQDLERWLGGKPIEARPVSRRERVWKWARRRPALAALVLVSVLSVLTLSVGTIWVVLTLNEARNNAEQLATAESNARADSDHQRAQLQVELDRVRRLAFASQLLRASAIAPRYPDEALTLISDESACPADLRDFAWGLLYHQCRRDRRVLQGHAKAVRGIAFTLDGKTLISGGEDGAVLLWDVAEGKVRSRLEGQRGPVQSLSLSADGKVVATGGTHVCVWEVDTGRLKAAWQGPGDGVRGLVITPDGQMVAAVGEDETARLWEVATGKEQVIFQKSETERVRSLAISPDGATLALGHTRDRILNQILLWDLKAGKVRQTLRVGPTEMQPGPITTLAFSPDGKTLASGGGAGYALVSPALLWDVAEGKLLATLVGQRRDIHSVAFRRDGTMMVAATGRDDDNGGLTCWELPTGRVQLALSGRRLVPQPVRCVAVAPDGQTLASAGDESAIRLYAVGTSLDTLASHGTLLRDGRTLLKVEEKPNLVGLAKQLVFRDVVTKQIRAMVDEGDAGELVSDATSADGGTWVGVYRREHVNIQVRIWDLNTGKLRTSFHSAGVWGKLAISADGKTLVWADVQRCEIWDVVSGKRRQTVATGADSLALTPDGKTLITGTCDFGLEPTGVKVWDVSTGKLSAAVPTSGSTISSVAVSSDGRCVAWREIAKNTIQLWDRKVPSKVIELRGHAGPVWDLAFSPDGKVLASASNDGTVKLWSAISGHEHASLTHADEPVAVTFSIDGTWLATNSSEGKVRIWPAVFPGQPTPWMR